MQKVTFKKLLTVALVLAAVWLGLKYCLPILRPFLFGAALALLAEPLVGFLSARAHIPRAGAAAIGVSMTLVVLVLLLSAILGILMRQLGALANAAPDLEDTARSGMASLQGFLEDLAAKSPKSIRPLAQRSVENMFSSGEGMLDSLAARVPGMATGLLKGLPDSALGFGTWLLSGFMISARLPRLKAWFSERMGTKWKERYLPALQRLRKTGLAWLFAQLKLMSVTALVLTAGFLLLQIPYAPLWAILISLIDALPVLGTGTVLVPWSLVCFIQGDNIRAVGLLGVYAAAWLMRSVLEPRLIGKQIGLDPLVTLFSMYCGYRLFGLGGMILAPLLAVILVQVVFSPQKGEN